MGKVIIRIKNQIRSDESHIGSYLDHSLSRERLDHCYGISHTFGIAIHFYLQSSCSRIDLLSFRA